MTSEPVPSSLAEALATLQGRLPRVAKDQTASVTSQRTGKTHSYRYADLLDVTEAMMPLLSALGLSFTCCPTMMDGRFVLNYSLLHVSPPGPGNPIGGQYPLPTTGSPQEIGTAITYARRYALCAVTGLAPGGDDDDAASAEAAHHAAGTRATGIQNGAHEPERRPRNVPDAQLAAEGRMTRAQMTTHRQLETDVKRSEHKAERSHPRGPDPDDPWAQDAPVDHERAAQLRGTLLTDPEDKPGTSSLAQQQAIAIELAAKGIGTREDKLNFCSHVTGRDIASSKELSFSEAAAVLREAGKLEAINA